MVSELHIRHPALAILILSSSQEAHYVHYAIKAGARGFVVKGDPYEIELDIRNVLTGKAYISPQLHIHPWSDPKGTLVLYKAESNLTTAVNGGDFSRPLTAGANHP